MPVLLAFEVESQRMAVRLVPGAGGFQFIRVILARNCAALVVLSARPSPPQFLRRARSLRPFENHDALATEPGRAVKNATLQALLETEARLPMRRMLDGGTFDPRAVAILSEVFEAVVAELDLRDIADREKAAKIIIRMRTGKRPWTRQSFVMRQSD
jgi:hypothetical protein